MVKYKNDVKARIARDNDATVTVEGMGVELLRDAEVPHSCP